MRTNIEIEDGLMTEALSASGLGTKRAVVEAGLRLLVAVRGQAAVKQLRGNVAWSGDLDAMRRDDDGALCDPDLK